ncbi:hypothetical protein ANCDUO_20200 [Ancylostoma duodenale]|uniref:Uncharacterized protein n=1 Tax=Ancylostoma duodenale TaxID=51022 RepID=A0A0C2FST0_9BILA|nr:hypothetical protein ANCDUO_20200 [Ancylostoma duodenale]
MSSSLAKWMELLPPELTRRPICSLKIPGSHDSGATQTLNPKLPVANDESASIHRLGKAPCVRRGIKRWAVTQRYSIREQLDNGVRYLDLLSMFVLQIWGIPGLLGLSHDVRDISGSLLLSTSPN